MGERGGGGEEEKRRANEREKVRLIKGRLNDGVCPPTSIPALRTPFTGGVWLELTRKVPRGFLKF